MGNFTSMVPSISLGCRSRTYSFAELKDSYEDNRRSVIPTALPAVEEEYVITRNECGEEVIIAYLSGEQ